jgi:cysteine desulfurase
MAIYLDHAATTPLAPEVRAAMEPFLGAEFANPSSRHAAGVRARDAIDRARAQVARALGVAASGVVFTSGGTEAANLALLGIARAARKRGRHVVVGPTEHASVRGAAAALAREGFEVEHGRLDVHGALDVDHFAARLRPDTALVAQMLAQNEVGTVYAVRELARLVRGRAPHARLVVDAVQAFGKLECSPRALGADAVVVSAHKIHGPKGAGALALADEGVAIEPLVHGGGQERGLRPGTENVAAIAGFGAAAEIAERERARTSEHLSRLRAAFVARLREIPGVAPIEPGGAVLVSIVAVRFDPAPAEVAVHHLEARGVLASAGAACQSAKREISPALKALGMSDGDARRTLRFSFARTTTEAEVERAAAALSEVARELAALAGRAR